MQDRADIEIGKRKFRALRNARGTWDVYYVKSGAIVRAVSAGHDSVQEAKNALRARIGRNRGDGCRTHLDADCTCDLKGRR